MVPKIMGVDVELGAVIANAPAATAGSGMKAARLLMWGVEADETSPYPRQSIYLANGGRVYIDHCHLEYCTPEVVSPKQLVAALRAGWVLVNRYRQRAEALLSEGQRIMVAMNNVDGYGSSWGGHINVAMDRKAFDALLNTRLSVNLQILLPFLASAVPLFGQGHVGPEGYQLSQRAEHITHCMADRTTYLRPLVNLRDESHTGNERTYARLHVIPFDSSVNEWNAFVKFGSLALIVALIEEQLLTGRKFVGADLVLEDPIAALHTFNHDPGFTQQVRLDNGKCCSFLDLQEQLLDGIRDFAARTEVEKFIPDTHEIISSWAEILDLLRRNDQDALSRRLDWAAKRFLVDEIVRKHGYPDWRVAMTDIEYANLNPDEGLYFQVFERNSLAERVTTDEEVACLVDDPPPQTRAFLRGRLIRMFGRELDHVDWDSVVIRKSSDWFPAFSRIDLPDPMISRDQIDPILQAESVGQLERILGSVPTLAVAPNPTQEE